MLWSMFMPGRGAILLCALATISTGLGPVSAAEEAPALSFVATRFAEPCDGKNSRLWLENKHTYKTIVATLRWNAAGGKVLTEQFFPPPGSAREIGCAAEAEVIEAKFAEF